MGGYASQKTAGTKAPKFEFCENLNISICNVTENNNVSNNRLAFSKCTTLGFIFVLVSSIDLDDIISKLYHSNLSLLKVSIDLLRRGISTSSCCVTILE